MSYPITENYIEDSIKKVVKKIELEISEFYLNGHNDIESDLSDMVSFRAFREGVIEELYSAIAPSRVSLKSMDELNKNLKND